MIDPNVPLATYVGKPKVRVVSPDGRKVIAWGNVLPAAEDGSKRQEAAVCSAFTRLALVIDDFMTKAEFGRVMAGNGPPRYNYKTGYYYDYGAHPDGHPSGLLICTDENLLVAKKPAKPPRPKDDGGTEADTADDDPDFTDHTEGKGDDAEAEPKE